MADRGKWNFGVLLQLFLAAAYLYILYGTDMVREPWIAKWDSFLAFAKACLPLVIFSTTISVISGTLLRKSGYVSGCCILLIMVIVQTITICEWNGNVGFLLIYLLGRLAINTLCAILGGMNVFMELEGDKESLTVATTTFSIIALVILGIIGAVYAYSNRNDQSNGADLSSAEVVASTMQTATVTSDGLNFRSGPGAQSSVIKTLLKGDTVSVTGLARNGWLPVEYRGDKGYVSLELVTINQGTSTNLQGQAVISFPRTGMWKVTGRDTVKWTGDMIIDEMNANNFSGFFDWRGERNYHGREYVRGEYDPQTRKVTMQGYRLADASGIALGKYEAYLNKNNNDFESGKWTSGGVWNAKWQK
jgi:uncharacterized protein YraI